MRRLKLNILLIALLGLVSCHSNSGMVELRKADSLMINQPDSALEILASIPFDELKSFYEQAEYALLLTQAYHKNYIPLTSDSLILSAVNYFKSSSNKEYEARSYFYLGCTYREMNKIVSATDAFLKALRILLENEIDNKTLILTYEYLASCYEKQEFYDKAIEMYKQSYGIRVDKGDTVKIYYPMRGLAHLYLLQEQPDSALYYYKQSLEIAYNKNDSSWISTVYSDIARVYNEQEKYNEAYELISKSIACTPLNEDLTITYFLKGEILYNLNHTDSARHYLALSKHSANLKIRAASYDQLYQLEKKERNLSMGIVYADSFIVLYDSVYMLDRHSEMDQLMDNHELELHKQELTAIEQSRNRLWTGAFIILCVLVVFVFMLIDKQRKKRYIDLQNKLMKRRADALVLQEKMEKDAFGEGLNISNEQWVHLKTEQFELCKKLFRSSAYYEKIKSLEVSGAGHDKYWEHEEREIFYEMLRQAFADVILGLKTLCKELTQDDLLYCILILLGCSKHTICCCMAISSAAFKMRKSRLKAKMGDDLFEFVFSASHIL